MRDNWSAYDVNNAVDYLQNLLFFKLVEVCHLMGELIASIVSAYYISFVFALP